MFKTLKNVAKKGRIGMSLLCGALALTVAAGGSYVSLGYDLFQNHTSLGTVSAAEMPEGADESYLRLTLKESDEKEGTLIHPVEAYVLYLNGESVFALSGEDEMRRLVEDYEAKYAQEGVTLLSKSVSWKKEAVEASAVCTAEEGKTILESVDQAGLPLLSVLNVSVEEWEEEVPFEIVYETTDTLTKGHSLVKENGVNGKKTVKGAVLYANGEEISRATLGSATTAEPVSEVVLVGTREPGADEGTGTYVKPCAGEHSSGYGSRWGRSHTGIDWRAPAGTTIVASDTGRVKSAGWNTGGYGNLVVIDHGNGVETWYAHCSSISVTEGSVVTQGEPIATVGSTGRSTGNHLHFEIRINGTPVNPASYVK